MKKLIFILVLIIPCMLKAQVIFTDSVRYQLRKYLYEHKDALDPNTYSNGNLWIRSLLTSKILKSANQKSDSIDLLSFHDASPNTYIHILLVAGDKYQILNMRQSYDKIILNLLNFFNQNPEVDSRLLPLFNKKIYELFLQNTTKSQRGKWYDWWNQRDSLSLHLEVRYEDWIN